MTTGERMAKLEEKTDAMQKDIIEVKESVKSINSVISASHKELIDKMDNFIERSDSKYARQSEFVMWRNLLITGILLSIFVGMIGLYLQEYFHK